MVLAITLAVLAAAPLQPVTMDDLVVCRDTCTRYVPAKQAAKICAACLRNGGVAAWTDAYRGGTFIPESVVRPALGDSAWEIRWGVLRARARARAEDPATTLAAYVRSQPEGPKRLEACVVAAGAAALAEGKVLETARRSCAAYRQQLREAIEPQLYLPRAASQEEALRQLMLFLGEGAGRVILNAIRSRPDALDEVPAALLLRVARPDYPVGRILLKDADAGSAPEVNRLLAVYSKGIDALRPQLKDPDHQKRVDALEALARYLPLSEPEVESVLAKDPSRGMRLSAAYSLAESNDRTLDQEVKSRISSGEATRSGVELQVRWVELLGVGMRPGCGKPLATFADDVKLAPAVRGEAIAQLGACGEGKVLPRVLEAAEDDHEELRAGAMRALVDLPNTPVTAQMAAQALNDTSPTVVAAALGALSAQNRNAAATRAPDFVAHASPEVRLAAARMLATDARESQVGMVKERLKVEPDPRVRAELVRALGVVGGTVAVAVLAELKSKDPDEYVRMVAVDSLRNLGFRR